MMAISSWF
jgi:hypothetical protein